MLKYKAGWRGSSAGHARVKKKKENSTSYFSAANLLSNVPARGCKK